MRPHLKASEQGAVFIHVAIGTPGADRVQRVRRRLRHDVGQPRPGPARGGRRCARGSRLAGVRRRRRQGGYRRSSRRSRSLSTNAVWGEAPGAVARDARIRRGTVRGRSGVVRARRHLSGRDAIPARCCQRGSATCSALPARACARWPWPRGRRRHTTCLKPWAVADKWIENWEDGAVEPRRGRPIRSSTST